MYYWMEDGLCTLKHTHTCYDNTNNFCPWGGASSPLFDNVTEGITSQVRVSYSSVSLEFYS